MTRQVALETALEAKEMQATRLVRQLELEITLRSQRELELEATRVELIEANRQCEEAEEALAQCQRENEALRAEMGTDRAEMGTDSAAASPRTPRVARPPPPPSPWLPTPWLPTAPAATTTTDEGSKEAEGSKAEGGLAHDSAEEHAHDSAEEHAHDSAEEHAHDSAEEHAHDTEQGRYQRCRGRYQRFLALANARKLALAAHGYEIEHVFIDDLFDAAEGAKVPPDGYAHFLRAELPFDAADEALASAPMTAPERAPETAPARVDEELLAYLATIPDPTSPDPTNPDPDAGPYPAACSHAAAAAAHGAHAATAPAAPAPAAAPAAAEAGMTPAPQLTPQPTPLQLLNPSISSISSGSSTPPPTPLHLLGPASAPVGGGGHWARADSGACFHSGPSAALQVPTPALQALVQQRRRERELRGAPTPARRVFTIVPESARESIPVDGTAAGGDAVGSGLAEKGGGDGSACGDDGRSYSGNGDSDDARDDVQAEVCGEGRGSGAAAEWDAEWQRTAVELQCASARSAAPMSRPGGAAPMSRPGGAASVQTCWCPSYETLWNRNNRPMPSPIPYGSATAMPSPLELDMAPGSLFATTRRHANKETIAPVSSISSVSSHASKQTIAPGADHSVTTEAPLLWPWQPSRWRPRLWASDSPQPHTPRRLPSASHSPRLPVAVLALCALLALHRVARLGIPPLGVPPLGTTLFAAATGADSVLPMPMPMPVCRWVGLRCTDTNGRSGQCELRTHLLSTSAASWLACAPREGHGHKQRAMCALCPASCLS